MSKAHRGKGLLSTVNRGRGVCKPCGKSRIKVLYDFSLPDGTKTKVCKVCHKKGK